ncbi:non-reducing end alpha-L-arabinofuranosidase family hydrolase [Micromonospora sp. CA-263727]|uniref:non-reducing end alpha-L-arabinofuranosidase family hydrolase n=1 Tax=Micromonospora sp. CA-263727 TaxID=3239967 RepID=UPI003D8BB6A6
MSQPVIAMQDANRNRLFEAANVYKVDGGDTYLMLHEAIGSDGGAGSVPGPRPPSPDRGRRWPAARATSTRAWTPTPAATTTACPGGSACSRRPTPPAESGRSPATIGHHAVHAGSGPEASGPDSGWSRAWARVTGGRSGGGTTPRATG